MNKPTIPDAHENTSTLTAWLRCYPFMARNPAMWFARMNITLTEREKRVFPAIAEALGQPLEPASNPHIINLPTNNRLEKSA